MQQKRLEGDREHDLILMEVDIEYMFLFLFKEKTLCIEKKIFKQLQGFG